MKLNRWLIFIGLKLGELSLLAGFCYASYIVGNYFSPSKNLGITETFFLGVLILISTGFMVTLVFIALAEFVKWNIKLADKIKEKMDK